ncbi:MULTISPECIES: hypothetical protein [Sphingobium]|uniref:hypothetical protein n=1 Tax=Sphingobium sp. MI1205 TaxID=407020 RepID=UPI0007705656|nr:hypothetical protein [Sphingobium sp. MI1205]AMK20197.1 hypothetical protein K663_19193 [Sphingobium sp. MI1205]
MAPSPAAPDLLTAYATAQAALVRIEERGKLSPVRGPWRTRTALAERQALAAADAVDWSVDNVTIDARGRLVPSAYDLTHWKQAIGAPITLAALAQDPAALLAWLGADQPRAYDAWAAPLERDPDARLAAVARWQQACRALPPAPPLLHAARLAALWRQHAPLGKGDRVASLLIGDRWGAGRWRGSQGGLTALGLQHGGAAWTIAQGAALDRLWLEAIAAGATAHCESETRLRGYAQRAGQVFERRRRLGRLKEVIWLAMARPFVTSAQVAHALGLTSAGAIKLLTIAVDEGLLLERTGQASYRSYAIPVTAPSPPPRRRVDPFAPDFWAREGETEPRSEPL